MISIIEGTCIDVSDNICTVMTGAIGYDIYMPTRIATSLPMHSNQRIYTHFVVREDAHMLFGFLDRHERDIFRILIKANQVGPKLACSIIDSYKPQDIAMIVQTERLDMMKSIKGIGPRMAEKLLVQLKGYLGDFPVTSSSSISSSKRDAIDALISLGYKENQIKQALQSCSSASTEEIIRQTLAKLSS